MKRKGILAVVCVLLLALVMIFLRMPVSILKDKGSYEVTRVTLYEGSDVNLKTIDVTEGIDRSFVLEKLQAYTRSRFAHTFTPYQTCLGDLEISVSGETGELYHFWLSEERNSYIVYESAEKGGYTIKEGSELYKDLFSAIRQAVQNIPAEQAE